MIRRLVSYIFASLFSCGLCAQTRLYGVVCDKESGEPAVGVMVSVLAVDGSAFLGVTTTDSEGKYEILFRTDQDSVRVSVSGFNIRKEARAIKVSDQECSFRTIYDKLAIKESVVKSEPIKRTGDTLTYYVGNYLDSTDRAIGDVLRKLPGVAVTESGRIFYNNKPINKFYVEGLDLMEGRYGVVTNNVRAKDVSKVEILENHQPVKSLRNIISSNSAAVNLRLKDSGKGSAIAAIQFGLGYSPTMWNNQAAIMYFSGKYQSLSIFKTDNSGEDILTELSDQYEHHQESSAKISIIPPVPELGKERYMDNRTFALSVNNLAKIDSVGESTLNANVTYYNDYQKYSHSTEIIEYLPGSSVWSLRERNLAHDRKERIEINANYTHNGDKAFFRERMILGFGREKGVGVVSDTMGHNLRVKPDYRLKNILNVVRTMKNGWHFSFQSETQMSGENLTYEVYPPMLELVSLHGERAVQQFNTVLLDTKNHLSVFRFLTRDIRLTGLAGVDYQNRGQVSSLNFNTMAHIPDSLANDVSYNYFRPYFNASLTYGARNVEVSAGGLLENVHLGINDHISDTFQKKTAASVNPFLRVNYRFSPSFTLISSFSRQRILSPSSPWFGNGLIMTGYRTISGQTARIVDSRYTSFDAQLRYADALSSLFGSLEFTLWKNKSDVISGIIYDGIVSRTDYKNSDNLSYGYRVDGRMEKRFSAISTTIGLPFGYHRILSDNYRNGWIFQTTTEEIPLGLKVSSRISRAINFSYNMTASIIGGSLSDSDQKLPQMTTLNQTLIARFFPKRFCVSVLGEHYFNKSELYGNNSAFFIDATLSLRLKKIELILEGRNLLNDNTYAKRTLTGSTEIQNIDALRPASVMLKLRFNIH